jgi:hypothetical protein
VSERLVSALLPPVLAGLSAGSGRDFAAASLMVLSHLAARAALSPKLLAGERRPPARPLFHARRPPSGPSSLRVPLTGGAWHVRWGLSGLTLCG